MNALKHAQRMWEGRTDPGHRHATEQHYASYARELLVLFPEEVTSVLELGCGNGALYPHLGFDHCARYRGVELSSTMLRAFKNAYPTLDLLQGEASSYRDDHTYGLIFSCELIQFFDRQMLREHLHNARRMMGCDSVLICASIPWKQLRFAFHSGCLAMRRASMLRGMASALKRRFIDPNVGHWYDYSDMRDLASEIGCSAEMFGCMHYPYRFHCVIRPMKNAVNIA